MKIAETIYVIRKGKFANSSEWEAIRASVHCAIKNAEWPEGSGKFLIYPESGKKAGEGNGVVPIKKKSMEILRINGWKLERPWDVLDRPSGKRKGSTPGDIDAAKEFSGQLVVVEWETGNVSSSHRSLNKMALGILKGKCIAGLLVVPNAKLAKYLTDRIGNIEELKPYLPLWQALKVKEGVLEIIVIEQDGDSKAVPRIPKGKDGRAKEGASKKATANQSKKN